MNKRGISADIFKWVLVSVVGAVILIFFFRFAFQHVGTSERISGIETVNFLDNQLDAFASTDDLNKIITLKREAEFNFDCSTISNPNFVKNHEKIIFAPNYLKGSRIITWSKNWRFPFSIANLYYLSNEGNRVLLIYDGQSANFVQNLDMPNIFNLQLMDVNNFDINQIKQQSSTLNSVNLIFFTEINNPNSILSALPNANLVKININRNEARIYKQNIDAYYLNNELLYGLIFSPEKYDCLLKKSVDRLKLISSIYENKLSMMTNKVLREDCRNLITQGINILSSVKSVNYKEGFYDFKNKIEQINRDLGRNGCPTIY